MRRDRIKSSKQTWHLLALSLLILIAWSSSIPNGFVWDDTHVILKNHFIRDLGNLRHLATPVYFDRSAAGHYTRSGELSYRPLTTLTHFVDFQLFGLRPWGYHLFNVLLHLLVTLLVFTLIDSLTGARAASIAGAALFGVHTVHTEAVNMVSYRDDLLVCLFFCAAFLAHRRAVRAAAKPGESRIEQSRSSRTGRKPKRPQEAVAGTGALNVRWLMASSAFLILALLSKEMAVTFTGVVILHDIIFMGGKRGLKQGWPAYLAYITLTSLCLIVSLWGLPNRPHQTVSYPGGSWLTGLATSARVLVHYLRLLVFPLGLKVDYHFRASQSLLEWGSLASMGGLAAAAALVAKTRSPEAKFFSLWFIVALVPVLGFIPIANFIAERYLYLPSVGFAGLAAWALGRAGGLFDHRSMLKWIGTALVCVFILSLTLLTFLRGRIWRDDLAFFGEMVNATPESHKGHGSLGIAYLEGGDMDAAIRELREAARLEPGSAISLHNLAGALIRRGDFREAVEHLEQVLEIDPGFVEAHYHLALIEARQEKVEEAVQGLRRSLELNPNFIPSHLLLGALYRVQDELDAAVKEFRSVLRLDTVNAKAHLNLAEIMLEEMGDCEAATVHFQKYLLLRPNTPGRLRIEAMMRERCQSKGIGVQGSGIR